MEQHKEEEFYIGYTEQAPKGVAGFIKRTLIITALLLVLIATSLVLYQKGFSNATFELTEQTSLKGVLSKEPQPFLKVHTGNDVYGNPLYKNVLLLNYGKFGAHDLLKNFEKKVAQPLEQTMVELEGKLLYHNGVTLLELSKQETSLLSHSKLKTIGAYEAFRQDMGTVSLQGQIIDPKCYFGAMKPGEGKPHRACAIRCISGGIPPVLAIQRNDHSAAYYLLLGAKGEAINQKVLDFVAEPVEVRGRLKLYDEWSVIYINDTEGIKRL